VPSSDAVRAPSSSRKSRARSGAKATASMSQMVPATALELERLCLSRQEADQSGSNAPTTCKDCPARRTSTGTVLGLDGGADRDVADFDVVWLFDGEGDRAGDGLGGDGEFSHAAADLVADRCLVDGVGELGSDVAG